MACQHTGTFGTVAICPR